MPSLAEAIKAAREGGYIPVDADSAVPNSPLPVRPFRPRMRSPMPPVPMTPDTMRQADLGGQVPQRRSLTPTPPNPSGGGTTVSSSTVVTTSGSSSSTSTSSALTPLTASLNAPSLTLGAAFTTSIQLSKSFQLLSVFSDIAVRVELYGTQTQQFADISRALDVSPTSGLNQNIITDVALDTAPYQWTWQNRVGANGDSPQTATIYITVTALTTSGVDANISINYLPLES